ncbi:hypothetical protein [Pseudomonas sp. Z1-6]|uniref:hypothetical protein n=1 Tax=Pseudomonas sp. Z1-6 TaxID=2817407 RepID=UPI003DA8C64D
MKLSIDFEISEDHANALHRFNETCMDGQEYDVRRSVMKSMTYVGLVRWCGGSRFEITDLGISVLEAANARSA